MNEKQKQETLQEAKSALELNLFRTSDDAIEIELLEDQPGIEVKIANYFDERDIEILMLVRKKYGFDSLNIYPDITDGKYSVLAQLGELSGKAQGTIVLGKLGETTEEITVFCSLDETTFFTLRPDGMYHHAIPGKDDVRSLEDLSGDLNFKPYHKIPVVPKTI